nr:TetR family transcriptional regulator C-terminal domain-containing protein [Marivibrio halodurans]
MGATLWVIARQGLSGTTMERVAGRAGISPGSVTFHFARKDALLLAALDHVVAMFEGARRRVLMEAGDDPARALERLIDISLDPRISAPDAIAVWTAFWGEAKARRLYLERVGEADAVFQADLLTLCRRMLAGTGARNEGRAAEALARGLGGLIDGLWQDALVAGRSFDRAAARDLAISYLATVFPNEPRWHVAPGHDEEQSREGAAS